MDLRGSLLLLFLLCGAALANNWAIEFTGTQEDAVLKSSAFAALTGFSSLGRIGSLAAYEFSIPSDLSVHASATLEATKRVLRAVQTMQPRAFPSGELKSMFAESVIDHDSSYAGVAAKDILEFMNRYGIRWAQEQVPKRFEKRSITDPLYVEQYHLHKYAPNRVSLNVTGAWERGFKGNGVTIAIVDDGLQHQHPDISANYRPQASYNFDFDRADPSPSNMIVDYHGTSSAGVAAARDDGSMCGVGVAYRAGLSGLVILQKDALNDAKEAKALQYQLGLNHIYSNSWGPPDGGAAFAGPGPLTRQALANGIRTGRNGLGAIYVWAGGNGAPSDNCNYDGYASLRTVVTVGAVDINGIKASFSEECASLLIMAPSASSAASYIRTTDLLGRNGRTGGDCNVAFSGTSAACPAVAGVVALMLEANPSLTWLDVQRVLIETATRTDTGSPSWMQNGAGYWVSHMYGFGVADASEAVRRSIELKSEPSMNKEVSITYEHRLRLGWTPQGNRFGTVIDIPVVEDVVIHHVEVIIDVLSTPNAGNLEVVLLSPSGTPSVLAKPHRRNDPNLMAWVFTTKLLWKEHSIGGWQLKITDSYDGGSLTSHSLRIWGTPTETINGDVVRRKTSTEYEWISGPQVPTTPTPIRPPPPPTTPPPKPSPPPVQAPISPPTPIPTEETEPKPNKTKQIIILIASVFVGLILISAAVIGIYWYWKSNSNVSYENLGGAAIQLDDDGLVGADVFEHDDDLGLEDEEGPESGGEGEE